MTDTKPVGYLDAYEDQEFLENCFIETPCYIRVLSSDNNFICGRRGSGKSAMVLKLMESTKYNCSDEVKGDEFYQHLLLKLKNESIGELDTKYMFKSIWRHLILVAAMNAITSKYDDSDYIRIELEPMYSYLKANKYFGKRPFSLWQKLINSLSSLIKRDRSKDNFAGKIHDFLSGLLENKEFVEAEASLKKYLMKNPKCLIVIDTILDYFQRDEIFVRCVEGLMTAVLELTCKKYSENLEVKCCVPGEVFPYIKMHEISKIKDHLIHLNWRPKDLIRMISKRLFYYLVISGTETKSAFEQIDWDSYQVIISNVWNRFFPTTLQNLRKFNESTNIYVLRHTHLTPRELIRIINKIVEEYDVGSKNELQTKIMRAVHESITDTVEELIISNEFLLPNLSNILEISFQGHNRIIGLKDIRQLLTKSKSFWKSMSDEPLTEDVIINYLIGIGFFGLVLNFNDIKSTNYVIKCKFSYLVPDKITFNKDSFLAIHPIFYERFNILPEPNKLIYPVRHIDEDWDQVN